MNASPPVSRTAAAGDATSAAGLTASGSPGLWRTGLFAMALFVGACLFLANRIETSRRTIGVDDCVLGADVAQYSLALTTGDYLGLKARKHPLAVAAVAGLATPLTHGGVPRALAGSIALALIEASGVAAFFLFLRRHFTGDGPAAGLTVLFLSTFAAMTLFGVPETYGVTFAATAFALLVHGGIARFSGQAPLKAAILAGLVGMFPGWGNLPAAACVLAYGGLAWPHLGGRAAFRLKYGVAIPCLIALAGTLIPTFLLDAGDGFTWQDDYIQKYADVANFSNGAVIGNFVAGFFVFALVAPLDHVLSHYVATDLRSMLADGPRVLAWMLLAGILGFGIARGCARQRTRPVAVALLGVVGGFFVFYLYFNPKEVLLYSPQWIAALFAAAATGYADGPRMALPAMMLATVLCFSLHLDAVFDDRTLHSATCHGG